MLKFFSDAVDIFTSSKSALNDLRSISDKRKFQRLGSTFFLCHGAFCRAWLCGEHLIRILERLRKAIEQEKMAALAGTNEPGELNWTNWLIEDVLSEMKILADNIRYGSALLHEIRSFGNLIEPGWKQELDKLVGMKADLVSNIALELEQGLLLTKRGLEHVEQDDEFFIRFTDGVTWTQKQVNMTREEIRSQALEDVATKLDIRELSKQNAAFRTSIMKLGEFIEKHFSLSELIAVDLDHTKQLKW